MKLRRFINNLDTTPLHSSGFASSGAPAPQSFTERAQLEHHRQVIKSYQQSLMGSARVERGTVASAPRPKQTISRSGTLQRFNASSAVPMRQAPSLRSYNPYA
jgi:hypothetical protein